MWCGVVAVARDLPQVAAIAIDDENLTAPLARRHEREMAAVGRPRRAFIGAFTERDLPGLAAGEVQDLDVVAGPRPRRERDLIERRRRPRRAIGVGLRRYAAHARPVDVDGVDLRR